MSNNGGWSTWSQTAANNAVADNTVNWQEGQSPSSINDSGRAMMSSVAKGLADISGSIVTTGTSTAYVLSSNQNFGSATAQLNNQLIAFTPNVTSGAAPTLIVDGIGPFPIQSAPNVPLPAGVLVAGTPYAVLFNSSANAFFLQGFFGNPYNIPIGGMIDYIGATAPNSSFALPAGQLISRTTYATLFSLISTTYGAGDGSTTFGLPDLRGRVVAALDNLNGTAANRITTAGSGIAGTTLGATGGAQNVDIAQSGLPNVAPTFTGTPGTATSTANNFIFNVGNFGASNGTGSVVAILNGNDSAVTSDFTPAGTISSINGNMTQTPTIIMPPTFVATKLLRII